MRNALAHAAPKQRPAVNARSALHGIAAQLRALASEIDRLEAQILDWHRNDETSRRLATIPGDRPDYSFGYCTCGARRISIPIRSSVCGLAWADTSCKQLGWQRAARRNNQAGRWLSSPASGRRFDGCYANDAQESGSPTLDGGPARAQAYEDRDSGARQQNSTDCMGRDDAEGGLCRRRMRISPSLARDGMRWSSLVVMT